MPLATATRSWRLAMPAGAVGGSVTVACLMPRSPRIASSSSLGSGWPAQ